MIKYRGRLSFLQYLPAKPTKYGVNFFSLCDSVSGYCCRLVGSEDRFTIGEGFVFNVVTHLLNHYLLRDYVLFTDNFYTSIKLAKHLRRYNTHLVGTVRTNSIGFPNQWLAPGDNIKL